MKKPQLFYTALLLFITGAIFYSTKATGFNHDFSEVAGNFRITFIVFDIIIILKLMHLLAGSSSSNKAKNFTVGLMALMILFLVLEVVFMFIPRSYGSGEPENLSERLWFAKYWRTNTYGYRDAEINPEEDKKKFKIMILGDSFVAGHGIKDPEQRFSNLLQKKLPEKYRVFNLGLNGADTQAEFDKLTHFPLKPDLLILAHYVNDIERVSRKKNNALLFEKRKSYSQKAEIIAPPLVKTLIRNSYLFNYFYYKFATGVKIFSNKKRKPATKEYMLSDGNKNNYQSFYLRKDMFQEHLNNLYRFVLLGRQENIPLLVLLFPEAWDETIDYSETYINKPIRKFFNEQGIQVLDTYSLFKELPVYERVINNTDAHPSVVVNQKIADALYARLTSLGLVH